MKTKYINIFFFSAAIALCLFSSCSKKEGSLDRKQRIDFVSAVENHYENNALTYAIDNYTAEDWHWDGKKMYRIDYGGDHQYSENFFFDNHNRILRTTIPAYNIRNEFFYDGRQLERIEVFYKDEHYSTMSFVHDGKELTEIECSYLSDIEPDNPILAKKSSPLSLLFGNKVGELFSNTYCKTVRNGKSNASVHYSLLWNEDNVTTIVYNDGENTYNIEVTYDDKRNPYNQLYGFREFSDPIFGFRMLSENNVTSIRMPYDGKNQTFTYSYEYDGDYPSKRTLSYSYKSVNFYTLDSVMYKYEKAETFNYLD